MQRWLPEARAFARTQLHASLQTATDAPATSMPLAFSIEGDPLVAGACAIAADAPVSLLLGAATGPQLWFGGFLAPIEGAATLDRLRAIHGSDLEKGSRLEISQLRWRPAGGEPQAVEPAAWRLATPEWADGEAGVLEHMNDDHVDAMRRMCAHFHGELDVQAPTLVAADPEGLVVRAGCRLLYFPFSEPALTMHDVHMSTVGLARAARGVSA